MKMGGIGDKNITYRRHVLGRDSMAGFFNSREAARFLGGRSLRWLRAHLHDIPHLRLYDRLIFDPAELRRWVERTAERSAAGIDISTIIKKVNKELK